ncbi:MAG: glutathione S-transferase C-terminal domain-containing protein, partial [Cohaesibacteraceae bacterium]|nr:glutathione S-transferase C-terminal domain-containing protein [Cohaesibacteraceae bacterium]
LSQNDPDGWLKPLSGNVDDALLFIKQLDGPFKHHLDLYKYSSRFETEDPALNRQKALENLQPLINRLSHNTFLFGNKPCIADIASFPFVRQFANTDVTWFENSTPLILQNWLNKFIQSSLFESIFAKYTPWTPGDPETLFPDPG